MICYNLRLILLVTIPVVVMTLAQIDEEKCKRRIGKNDKITEDFPKIVVHGIHSMTLANLRYYFEPNAPANNNIPVINFNLSSSEPSILSSAPDIPLRNNFTHPAMDALDQVLSHMTDNDWDIRNAPPLERIVHAIHMLEVWEMAKPFYRKLKRNAPKRIRKLCPCLTAVDDNGIVEIMKNLAKKMRDTAVIWRYIPAGSSGCNNVYGGCGKRCNMWKGSRCRRRPCSRRGKKPICNRSLGQVEPSSSQPATNLTNEAEWEIWKSNIDMSENSRSHGYQLALYLYCALN